MDRTEVLRREARAWFEENWDPDLSLREWWCRLFDGRWTVPTWPEAWYGRGLSTDLARVVRNERQRVGAVPGPGGMGVMLAGPTLLVHGTEEQKRRYLPAILRGEEAWCQLFSEPVAGSDLAGLQTRASPDGDGWRVTGQKVWSSGASEADLGMLLVRTTSGAPKHHGITYFILEMDQPGIQVRPIREMTGRALFNEVFLDDAEVSPAAVVGELNGGWAVAQTTLAAERSGLGGGSEEAGGIRPGLKGGMLDRRVADLVQQRRTRSGTSLIMSGRTVDRLVGVARERGVAGDALIRQRLAQLWALEQISTYTALRTRAAAKSGRPPGPEASTLKLHMSRLVRLSREVGFAILGADGTVVGPTSATEGVVQEMGLFSPAPSIYGGTDEIQRNLIGERVLGLPRDSPPAAM